MENNCKKIIFFRGINDKEKHFMSNFQGNKFICVFFFFYNG